MFGQKKNILQISFSCGDFGGKKEGLGRRNKSRVKIRRNKNTENVRVEKKYNVDQFSQRRF